MKNYIFEDFPKKQTLYNYQKARYFIEKYFKKDKNILSIYEYGKTHAPGISDLDIILVFNSSISISSKKKIKYDLQGLDKEIYNFVKQGSVIKMNKLSFRSIQYYDQFNLKLLCGKNLKYNQPSKSELKVIKSISINDWIPERLLRLQLVINSKKIKISNTLCVLNSLCYSLIYLKSLNKYNKEINYIAENTKLLRKDWYKLSNPKKKLINLIRYSILTTKKIYFSYSKYFQKNFVLKDWYIPKYDVFYEIKKNNIIVFTDNSKRILNNKINKIKKDNKNYLFVSKVLFNHFNLIASEKTSLSVNMKNKIYPSINKKSFLKSSYKNLLRNKIKKIEKNKIFLDKYKFKVGLIRYGFLNE